jgi:hypothetical protein
MGHSDNRSNCRRRLIIQIHENLVLGVILVDEYQVLVILYGFEERDVDLGAPGLVRLALILMLS